VGFFFAALTLYARAVVADEGDVLLEFEPSFESHPFIRTVHGEPSYGEGIAGRSLDLKGQSYLEVSPDFFDSSRLLGIMAWVRLDSHATEGQTPILVDRDENYTDYQLVVLPDNFKKPHRLMFTLGDESGQLTSVLSDEEVAVNVWTQVAVVYNGQQVRLYINGSPTGSPLMMTSPVLNRAVNAYLGGDVYGNVLNGSLDQVVVARRVFTEREIQEHFLRGYDKARITGALIAYTQQPNGAALPLTGDLLISDMAGNSVKKISGGSSRKLILTGLTDKRLSLDMSLNVPGFGLLRFTAERGGGGVPTDEGPLDLVYEVARHRMAIIQSIIASWRKISEDIPFLLDENIKKAATMLAEADRYPVGSLEKTMFSMESLKYSGPAGEKLVVEKARSLLGKKNGYKNKKVSSYVTYLDQEGERMRQAIDPLINMGVVVWHWALNMPQEGSFQWALLGNNQDTVVDWITSHGKEVRGHALIWLSALPKWIQKKYPNNPYPTSFEIARKKILAFSDAVVRRYPQVQFWNIANELNNSWSNLGFIEPEQSFELVREVGELVKDINPGAKRGINIVPSTDDAFGNISASPRVLAPYPYLLELIQRGVDFEFVGLQMYFSGRGLLEFDQLLERYSLLGKRIHVTELQTSAFQKPQSGNRSFLDGVHPAVKYYQWHRPWDEKLQSEWLEGTFLISLSKDYVDEWNWWDIADYNDQYFPWGGLMDKDYAPRPAYQKLKALISSGGINERPN